MAGLAQASQPGGGSEPSPQPPHGAAASPSVHHQGGGQGQPPRPPPAPAPGHSPIQNPSLQGKEPHTLAGPSRDGGAVKPKTGGQSEGGAAGAQRTGSPGRERKRKRKLPTESGPRVDRHGGAWPRAPLASPLLREVTLTSHHKGGADLTGPSLGPAGRTKALVPLPQPGAPQGASPLCAELPNLGQLDLPAHLPSHPLTHQSCLSLLIQGSN